MNLPPSRQPLRLGFGSSDHEKASAQKDQAFVDCDLAALLTNMGLESAAILMGIDSSMEKTGGGFRGVFAAQSDANSVVFDYTLPLNAKDPAILRVGNDEIALEITIGKNQINQFFLRTASITIHPGGMHPEPHNIDCQRTPFAEYARNSFFTLFRQLLNYTQKSFEARPLPDIAVNEARKIIDQDTDNRRTHKIACDLQKRLTCDRNP